MRISMAVNRRSVERDVEPRTLLVHFIRNDLDLTGTNIGCDTAQCGACTVHLNGQAIKSCATLAVQADGAEITTIEGLANDGALHPMQQAFWDNHGLQCGYCTPGMIMAAVTLVERNPNPSDDAIRHGLEGNL
ncbi:MAG: (2Fe-2S)-binding protein, partial [Candidatus Promineifilaceae bacterium]